MYHYPLFLTVDSSFLYDNICSLLCQLRTMFLQFFSTRASPNTSRTIQRSMQNHLWYALLNLSLNISATLLLDKKTWHIHCVCTLSSSWFLRQPCHPFNNRIRYQRWGQWVTSAPTGMITANNSSFLTSSSFERYIELACGWDVYWYIHCLFVISDTDILRRRRRQGVVAVVTFVGGIGLILFGLKVMLTISISITM